MQFILPFQIFYHLFSRTTCLSPLFWSPLFMSHEVTVSFFHNFPWTTWSLDFFHYPFSWTMLFRSLLFLSHIVTFHYSMALLYSTQSYHYKDFLTPPLSLQGHPHLPWNWQLWFLPKCFEQVLSPKVTGMHSAMFFISRWLPIKVVISMPFRLDIIVNDSNNYSCLKQYEYLSCGKQYY